MIHPSRAFNPTTQMTLSACISRDIAERTPAPENNVTSHLVECTSDPETPPGQRNWIVCFQYEDGSMNSYNGKTWTPKKVI